MNRKNEQEVEVLFNKACDLRIRADDFDKPGIDVELYNEKMGDYAKVYDQLLEYGDLVRPLFIKALSDPRPPIRLMGALWAGYNAVDLAPPILSELSNGHYGVIGLTAWSMLRDMRKRGLTTLR